MESEVTPWKEGGGRGKQTFFVGEPIVVGENYGTSCGRSCRYRQLNFGSIRLI